jgi:Fe-S oxidoreductase
VPAIAVFADRAQAQKVWGVRESALGATARVPGQQGDFWPGWEDSAVPPEQMGDYLRDLRALMDRSGHDGAFYGHFGQGCLHCRMNFDLKAAPGIDRFRQFIYEAADLVLKYGGSFSGEHGDGQARAELLPKMYGDDLVQAFGAFKALWDPENKMNPGKMVHPYRIDQNLRLGAAYNPPPLTTHFSYQEDRNSFAAATLRCVGVGKCRREGGGTMCPSYMVTREEEHSTRGRARLLFEMLQGDPIQEGWRSGAVKDALDLCLACKGCKGDCPVSVDMATYKAEFLSHYFAGRKRPNDAYAFGMIYRWARLASLMPGAANFVTQTPLLRDLAKVAINVAPARRIPAFAPRPFTRWFRERGERNAGKPEVLLWPDTFNNYFHPETAQAAVEVLEWAGYRVVIPDTPLCCGRPLYDYGMLDEAKRLLRQILGALRPQIAAGMPLVGLEPSCVAVFRDELTNLFPRDEDARRLNQQSFLLSEFLVQHAKNIQPPLLQRSALVHGHCHHKALMGMSAEEEVLKRLGLHFTLLDSGCCGMAGAFGFERDHYDVSIKVGERVLLPAVRAADRNTMIIADGFSCREQIAQTTGRRALHLAEVLQMAIRQQVALPVRDSVASENGHVPRARAPLSAAALAGAGALAGYGAVRWARSHRSTNTQVQGGIANER